MKNTLPELYFPKICEIIFNKLSLSVSKELLYRIECYFLPTYSGGFTGENHELWIIGLGGGINLEIITEEAKKQSNLKR